jgi:hypothetical protein
VAPVEQLHFGIKTAIGRKWLRTRDSNGDHNWVNFFQLGQIFQKADFTHLTSSFGSTPSSTAPINHSFNQSLGRHPDWHFITILAHVYIGLITILAHV